MTGKIKANGNIQSLLNYSNQCEEYCYIYLFYGCTALITAPLLPAKILAKDCYYEMFAGCTSLLQAPKLPATTLIDHCYYAMFYNCTSLTQAPELPATNLENANGCYKCMFQNCTSLIYAPTILPAMILVEECYSNMFNNCTALIQAPQLPATTLAIGCYIGMFYACKSLIRAPQLPATNLTFNTSYMCYKQMFAECILLSTITINCTTIDLGDGLKVPIFNNATGYLCTENWLQNVSNIGDFYCLHDLEIPSNRNASTIPAGWRINYID